MYVLDLVEASSAKSECLTDGALPHRPDAADSHVNYLNLKRPVII